MRTDPLNVHIDPHLDYTFSLDSWSENENVPWYELCQLNNIVNVNAINQSTSRRLDVMSHARSPYLRDLVSTSFGAAEYINPLHAFITAAEFLQQYNAGDGSGYRYHVEG